MCSVQSSVWLEMDEGGEVVDAGEGPTTAADEINRKRKLHSEISGQPLPKHRCRKHGCIVPGEQVFNTIPGQGKPEDVSIDDGLSSGSVKDSNSSVTSSNIPSTSALPVQGFSSTESLFSSSDRTGYYSIGTFEENVIVGNFRVRQMLEQQLLEYGNHVESSCFNHDTNCTGDSAEIEVEEFIHSNELHHKDFVLSSGRWRLNQGWCCVETQQSGRKPTIDQEFEQYFSMLML